MTHEHTAACRSEDGIEAGAAAAGNAELNRNVKLNKKAAQRHYKSILSTAEPEDARTQVMKARKRDMFKGILGMKKPGAPVPGALDAGSSLDIKPI